MKQPLGLSGKRLAGAGLITFGLLCSSLALAAIVSGTPTSSSSTDVTITQLTLAKPGVATGDLMLANISVNGGSSATITAPTGWTQILRTDNDTNVSLISYWKIAGASEPSSYTWSVDHQTTAKGAITPYTGIDATNPIDTSADNTGFDTSATTTSVTTSSANDEIVSLFAADIGKNNNAGAYFTTPTGMTEKYDITNTPFGPSTAQDEVIQAAVGSTGSVSSTISGGKARNWAAQTIALRMQQSGSGIAFDNSSNVNGTGTSCSFSLTVGSGAHNVVVVSVQDRSTSDPISALTVGGASASLIATNDTTTYGTELWYAVGVPAGSQTISVTKTNSGGGFSCGAASYTGVNQTTPIDSVATSSVVSGSSPLNAVTTVVASNAWLVMSVDGDAALSPGSDTTARISPNNLLFDSNGTVGTGGQQLQVTWSGIGNENAVIASLKPY